VIAADDPTLEQTAKRFNRLRVDFAAHKLIAFVRDEPMRITDLL
jgi:hypothetical protein